MIQIRQQFKVQIQRLALGGQGIGRRIDEPHGIVFFVERAVPGDLLLVEVTETSKRYVIAKIIEVLQASPDRVEPPCPHVNECGGCPWQMASYDLQISEKQKILKSHLEKSGAIQPNEPFPFDGVRKSPRQLGYRSRITVHRRNGKLGYLKRQSHDFVEIKDCLLAHPGLFDRLKTFTASLPASGATDKISFGRRDLVSEFSLTTSFSQVNVEQNQALQDFVCAEIQRFLSSQSVNEWALLDLYCGDGNLTFPVIENSKPSPKSSIGIELSTESIQRAKDRNSELNSVKFFDLDCAEWLSLNPRKRHSGSPEIVVIDPPRAGCDNQVIESLIQRRPDLLIYVSCNPATLGRDIARYRKGLEKAGFNTEIERVSGFDFFPQTDHIESAVAISIQK